MLRIRKEQQEVLGDAQVADFERRAAVHLQELLPEACEELDDTALRELIRHGIVRAASFGVVS